MTHHKESKLRDLNMAFDQTATFTCHDLHGDRQGRLGYSSDMLKKPCSCKSPWKPKALTPFWFVCLKQWESKHRVGLTGTAPSGWFVLSIQKGFQNLEDSKHEEKKVYDSYEVMLGNEEYLLLKCKIIQTASQATFPLKLPRLCPLWLVWSSHYHMLVWKQAQY